MLYAFLVSHMHEYAIFKNSKQEDAKKKLCNEGYELLLSREKTQQAAFMVIMSYSCFQK